MFREVGEDDKNEADGERAERLAREIVQALTGVGPAQSQPEEILGIEARSILKSLETESSKLGQFQSLSRTDRHYFRARFNYYKLSILRLRSEEREFLEPRLQTFHEQIVQREFEIESQDLRPTPFLEAVPSLSIAASTLPPASAPVPVPNHSHTLVLPASNSSSAAMSNSLAQDLINELQMLKMALQAKPSEDGQKIIAAGVDRILEKLKTR